MPAPVASPPSVSTPPPPDSPPLYRLTVHGVTAEIFGPPMLRRSLDIVLNGFPVAQSGSTVDIRISAERVKGLRRSWNISVDEKRFHAHEGVSSAALWVEWVLTSELIKRWQGFIHVHAGLVANERSSALLIGNSGSGKSTTSVALALAGLQLFADDAALIDRVALTPACMPRPVKLDFTARRLLRSHGLIVPIDRWLGESIDRMVMPGFPTLDTARPPLTTAIFLTTRSDGAPVARRMSNAEAALRLSLQSATEAFGYRGPSQDAVSLVNSVHCYELVPGNLRDTVHCVQDLMAEGGSTGHLPA